MTENNISTRLDTLHENLDAMVDVGNKLVTGIEILTYKQRRDRIVYRLLISIILLTIIIGFASIGLLFKVLSDRGDTTRQYIEQVLDCTQPTGKCWQAAVAAQLGNQGNALTIAYWENYCLKIADSPVTFKTCLSSHIH